VRSQLLLLMFFADMLTPQRMDEIIDKRLEELHYWQTACRQWRKEQRANESDCGPRFLVDYAMAMMKAEISFLTENSDRFVQQLTQASGEAT